MSMDFDTSQGCMIQIDALLKQYGGLGGTAENILDRQHIRSIMIDALFSNLNNFVTNHLADLTFSLDYDQDYIEKKKSDPAALFSGIADAISIKKGKVLNFYHTKIGEDHHAHNHLRHGRHLFCWDYLHYKITVVTKRTPPRPGFTERYFLHMRIVDIHQRSGHADSDDSGDDTEDDYDARKRITTFFILQSLHDRIKKLEASCGLQPTASQRRLE